MSNKITVTLSSQKWTLVACFFIVFSVNIYYKSSLSVKKSIKKGNKNLFDIPQLKLSPEDFDYISLSHLNFICVFELSVWKLKLSVSRMLLEEIFLNICLHVKLNTYRLASRAQKLFSYDLFERSIWNLENICY